MFYYIVDFLNIICWLTLVGDVDGRLECEAQAALQVELYIYISYMNMLIYIYISAGLRCTWITRTLILCGRSRMQLALKSPCQALRSPRWRRLGILLRTSSHKKNTITLAIFCPHILVIWEVLFPHPDQQDTLPIDGDVMPNQVHSVNWVMLNITFCQNTEKNKHI